VPNPSGPGSGEASLVALGGGRAALSWLEPKGEDHVLNLSVYEGGRFGEGLEVSRGSRFFVNWADFPTLAPLGSGVLFAHWLERSGGGRYAYDVKLARSRDAGRTWSAAVVPHRDRSAVEHGFVSMADDGSGGLALVWLDGRDKSGTALLSARADADLALSPEAVVDARVCDCCQTALVRTSRGLLAAYRDRSEDEIRDIAVARFEDGRWVAGQVVAGDGWKIDGCPVNGPALAADGDRVALTWFTAHPAPRVRLALSADAGRTWSAAVDLHEGRPLGRVDVAYLPTGGVVASFLEQKPAAASDATSETPAARLLLRPVDETGRPGPALEAAPTTGARSSGFPRLERVGDTLLLAWRDAAEPAKLLTAVVKPEVPAP
jgi:hypothetical protein